MLLLNLTLVAISAIIVFLMSYPLNHSRWPWYATSPVRMKSVNIFRLKIRTCAGHSRTRPP
jgi:hypothetical protein